MSSFVSAPPAPSSEESAPPPAVANDGWFPDVAIAATRDVLVLPTTVTEARLVDAIGAGILAANRQLAGWRALQEAASLAAVAIEDKIAGQPRLVILYLKAVRAFAAAELGDLEGEITATDGGRERRDVRASPSDAQRRIATHAIRDMLGKPRTKVSLV